MVASRNGVDGSTEFVPSSPDLLRIRGASQLEANVVERVRVSMQSPDGSYGMTYDSRNRIIFVAMARSNTVKMVDADNYTVFGSDLINRKTFPELMKPTSVRVVQSGVSYAILDDRGIIIAEFLPNFATRFFEFQYRRIATGSGRGLAVTPKGAAITFHRSSKSLVAYSTERGCVNKRLFEVLVPCPPYYGNASFMSLVGSRLIVTDLGSAFVEDRPAAFYSVWDIESDESGSERIKLVSSKCAAGKPGRLGEFKYISGVQVDRNGYSLIADAKSYSIQLFDNEMHPMEFVKVSKSDLPYISDMAVSQDGRLFLVSAKQPSLFVYKLKWVDVFTFSRGFAVVGMSEFDGVSMNKMKKAGRRVTFAERVERQSIGHEEECHVAPTQSIQKKPSYVGDSIDQEFDRLLNVSTSTHEDTKNTRIAFTQTNSSLQPPAKGLADIELPNDCFGKEADVRNECQSEVKGNIRVPPNDHALAEVDRCGASECSNSGVTASDGTPCEPEGYDSEWSNSADGLNAYESECDSYAGEYDADLEEEESVCLGESACEDEEQDESGSTLCDSSEDEEENIKRDKEKIVSAVNYTKIFGIDLKTCQWKKGTRPSVATSVPMEAVFVAQSEFPEPEVLHPLVKQRSVRSNGHTSFPMGVCFDEKNHCYFVALQGSNKVILINWNGSSFSPHIDWLSEKNFPDLFSPTAISVIVKARQYAVLDGRGIILAQFSRQAGCTFERIWNITNCRGLTVSPKGNVVTFDKGSGNIVFYDPHEKKIVSTYDYRSLGIPKAPFVKARNNYGNISFMSCVGSKLAVTDLGFDKNLPGARWILFDVLSGKDNQETLSPRYDFANEMHTRSRSLAHRAPEIEKLGGFAYVAGIQLDVNGWAVVHDACAHSLQLFDETGFPVGLIRRGADSPHSDFDFCSDIAITPDGYLAMCIRHEGVVRLYRLQHATCCPTVDAGDASLIVPIDEWRRRAARDEQRVVGFQPQVMPRPLLSVNLQPQPRSYREPKPNINWERTQSRTSESRSRQEPENRRYAFDSYTPRVGNVVKRGEGDFTQNTNIGQTQRYQSRGQGPRVGNVGRAGFSNNNFRTVENRRGNGMCSSTSTYCTSCGSERSGNNRCQDANQTRRPPPVVYDECALCPPCNCPRCHECHARVRPPPHLIDHYHGHFEHSCRSCCPSDRTPHPQHNESNSHVSEPRAGWQRQGLRSYPEAVENMETDGVYHGYQNQGLPAGASIPQRPAPMFFAPSYPVTPTHAPAYSDNNNIYQGNQSPAPGSQYDEAARYSPAPSGATYGGEPVYMYQNQNPYDNDNQYRPFSMEQLSMREQQVYPLTAMVYPTEGNIPEGTQFVPYMPYYDPSRAYVGVDCQPPPNVGPQIIEVPEDEYTEGSRVCSTDIDEEPRVTFVSDEPHYANAPSTRFTVKFGVSP